MKLESGLKVKLEVNRQKCHVWSSRHCGRSRVTSEGAARRGSSAPPYDTPTSSNRRQRGAIIL
eukprot:scaffold44851_cov60-Phaeocystis_antarctica.AAC.1